MSNSPNGAELSSVHEDSAPTELDESLDQLHHVSQHSEDRIADLEREVVEAADQEAEIARQLDAERTRRAVLDQQLREAREEAIRLRLDEATRNRDAMVAEAEALLETSRIEAEREASRIKKRTYDQAKEMLAEATSEAAAIVDAGREQLKVLEEDATQRVDDLETDREKLAHRLAVMETLYNELQETLRLVAETSIKELAETQESVFHKVQSSLLTDRWSHGGGLGRLLRSTWTLTTRLNAAMSPTSRRLVSTTVFSRSWGTTWRMCLIPTVALQLPVEGGSTTSASPGEGWGHVECAETYNHRTGPSGARSRMAPST